MAKKNGNQKFWIYGEDEELVARFTAYAATVLRNKRAEFIKNSKIISDHECSYDELSEAQKERCLGPSESIENIIEENELWKRIRNFLPLLTPQECQVMIYLYIDHLTPAQAAQKMGIAASTVIAVRFSPSANSRQATLPGALPRIALQPCDMFSRILARSWNPVMALLPQCGTAEDAIHFFGGLEPPNT